MSADIDDDAIEETPRPLSWNGERVPYGASAQELREMIEAGGNKRGAAFVALDRDGSPTAESMLIAYAANSDLFVRRIAIQTIANRPLGNALAQAVQQGLDDTAEYVVRTSIASAAKLQIRGALPRLRELLADGSPEVRSAVLRAMQSLRTEEDFSTILSIADRETHDSVRREAMFTLRSLASETNWPQLWERWQIDCLPRHRVWACELAGEFGSEEHVRRVQSLEDDRDGHVRKAAAFALQLIRRRV